MCCITSLLCPVSTTPSLLETMKEASMRVAGEFHDVDVPGAVMVTVLNGETEHNQGFGCLASPWPSFLPFFYCCSDIEDGCFGPK
jgi:hypothetical protein